MKQVIFLFLFSLLSVITFSQTKPPKQEPIIPSNTVKPNKADSIKRAEDSIKIVIQAQRRYDSIRISKADSVTKALVLEAKKAAKADSIRRLNEMKSLQPIPAITYDTTFGLVGVKSATTFKTIEDEGYAIYETHNRVFVNKGARADNINQTKLKVPIKVWQKTFGVVDHLKTESWYIIPNSELQTPKIK